MDQEEFTDQRQDLCPKDTKRVSNMCLHLLQQSYQFSSVAESCPTLRDPIECSLLGSSVHGIFQARVLEWGAAGSQRETFHS